MIQRRCHACGHWHDKKLGPCPKCGTAPHAFNKHARTAKLNHGLYKQAERAELQKRKLAA